jgi:hypothetical protein
VDPDPDPYWFRNDFVDPGSASGTLICTQGQENEKIPLFNYWFAIFNIKDTKYVETYRTLDLIILTLKTFKKQKLFI